MLLGGVLARPAPPPTVYYAPPPQQVYVEQPACRLIRERYWDGLIGQYDALRLELGAEVRAEGLKSPVFRPSSVSVATEAVFGRQKRLWELDYEIVQPRPPINRALGCAALELKVISESFDD